MPDTILSRLPSWGRLFLLPAGRAADADLLEFKYDEWIEDVPRIVEGKRAVAPIAFDFHPGGRRAVTLCAQRRPRALELTCVVGALWLTQDRDSADYVLSAGQSLRVDGRHSVVALAIGTGVLRVAPAATRARLR